VKKSYRPYSPKQAFLLPPSPTEWLPDDHLAYFVMDVVAQLDLSAIHRRCQSADPRGTQPYHPVMMTSLLVYGYCVGVVSSRKIEQRGRPPDNLTIKQRMVRKLTTKAGRAVYALRKKIVEPVFGRIKEARGLRRFLLRGLKKVRGEWALIVLTHNLLKIYRAQLRPA